MKSCAVWGARGISFACEADEVSPDIACIAKGLGAGYQPIGAMLCTSKIYDTIGAGSGFFQHGHTYLAHPSACAAGLAVVNAILARNLLEAVQTRSNQLFTALNDAFGQHPHVGDIRGRGLFAGIEIVEDREAKRPFDPTLKTAAQLKKAAFEAGLVCYPMSGTRDGRMGDHILLAPPFIISEAQDYRIGRQNRNRISSRLITSRYDPAIKNPRYETAGQTVCEWQSWL